MLYVTDEILTKVLKDKLKIDYVLFGHPDRVSKKLYNRETNILTNDAICLFRENIEYNVEIATGHNWNLVGFDLSKDEVTDNSLVSQVVPIIASYTAHCFLSSRFKSNDICRRYYFIKQNQTVYVKISDIFNLQGINLQSNSQFQFVIQIENPIDSTNYYSGDDNLTFRLDLPFKVETFLINPEIQPLIKFVDASFYRNEELYDISSISD